MARNQETGEIITYGEHTHLPLSAVVALARRRDEHAIISQNLDQRRTGEGKKMGTYQTLFGLSTNLKCLFGQGEF